MFDNSTNLSKSEGFLMLNICAINDVLLCLSTSFHIVLLLLGAFLHGEGGDWIHSVNQKVILIPLYFFRVL